MARPLRSLRQIPLPHPALEATRWHYLPTVGAATSWLPALPMLPPKGASLIIPNRQLSGRASGNADNYFLIIASDNNNYRHCLRAALGSHLRSVSPLPHPALEATRWHFLPTVGAATSLPPALPVLPPKGASQIIPYRWLSAVTCALLPIGSRAERSRLKPPLFVPSLVPRSLLPPRGPHLFWPCSRVGRARTMAFSFRYRSLKAFSLALRPRPTLAAALGKLLPSLRSGQSQLSLASALAALLHPLAKGIGSRAPPSGGSQFSHKKYVVLEMI